mgnify:CR=1 FL=1
MAAAEAAGCHVAAYVPDSSLLLVGSPQQAAALETHPAVLRLVSQWLSAGCVLGMTRCRVLEVRSAVMLPFKQDIFDCTCWLLLAQ